MSNEVATRPGLESQNALLLLLAGQVVWMAVPWVVFGSVTLWTFEVYYVVSFVGLLVMRVLAAPEDETLRWWTALDWVVRVGFVVLAYIVYTQVLEYF